MEFWPLILILVGAPRRTSSTYPGLCVDAVCSGFLRGLSSTMLSLAL